MAVGHGLGREGEADRIVACMKTRHEAYLWRDVIQSRVDVSAGTGSGAGSTASSSASADALDAGDEASKGAGEGGRGKLVVESASDLKRRTGDPRRQRVLKVEPGG